MGYHRWDIPACFNLQSVRGNLKFLQADKCLKFRILQFILSVVQPCDCVYSKARFHSVYNYFRGGSRISSEGAHLKYSRRAERGTKKCGVFRVKNHDFTQKNQFFSNFRPPPWILLPCISISIYHS